MLVIGGLCFIGFLGEGAALDWSALFLHGKGLATAYGGIGYAAFLGDHGGGTPDGRCVARRWGSGQAAPLERHGRSARLGCAVLLPGPAAVAGFALVGLGASNIVPLLFGAAARVPGVPTSVSIPLISALGYAGMLCGARPWWGSPPPPPASAWLFQAWRPCCCWSSPRPDVARA